MKCITFSIQISNGFSYTSQLSPCQQSDFESPLSFYQDHVTKSLCWKTPLATACPQALFTVIESSPSAEVWSSGRFEKQHHVVESTLTLEPDRRSLCSPMYSQSSFVHVENRDNNSNLKIYWNYLKGRITSSLQNEMFSIKEKSLLFFFFNHFPLHK